MDTPLETALSILEDHFNRRFVYDPKLILPNKVEKLQLKSASLEKSLTELLSSFELDYKFMSGKYILIKQKQKVQSEHLLSTTAPPKVQQRICGRLISSEKDKSLAYASVYLLGKPRGTLTDENGNFELLGQFSSRDTLVLQYLGFQARKLAASKLVDQPCRNWILAPQEFEIPDVLVEEEAVTLIEGAADGKGTRFLPDKLDVLPGWGDNDLLRMVQLLPGVQTTDESASNLHIRGGTPDQNLILWDGIPIYHSGHFFGLFSAFNPDIAQEINVYKGDFGARFGDRVSGVIDIKSKPNQLDSSQYAAGINMINAYGYAQIPLKETKVGLLLAGRRSYSDIFKSPTYNNLFQQLAGRGKIEQNEQNAAAAENLDFILTPNLNFFDVNAKLVIQNDQGGKGALSFYQGGDELSYVVGLDESFYFFNTEDNIRLRNWGLSFQWEQELSSSFSTNVQVILNDYRNRYRYSHTFDREIETEYMYTQLNTLSDFTTRWQNTWNYAPGHALNFGVEYNDRSSDLIFEEALMGDTTGLYSVFLESNNLAFYLDYDFKIEDELAINLGVRRSKNYGVNRSYLEPRFSFDWQPFRNALHLKGAAGLQVQTLGHIIENNELGFGERIWMIADTDAGLPEVLARQSSIGLWWKKNGWLLDIEAYRKSVSQITTLNIRFPEKGQNPYSGGIGNMEGVDILLRKRFNRQFDSWFTYAYGKVRYQFDQVNNNSFFPAAHDQQHTFTWTQIANLGPWSLSSHFIYGSGRPFTRAIGVNTINNPGQDPTYSLEFADRNQERLPSYSRLDVSAHLSFKTQNGSQGRVGISVLNLLDRFNIGQRRYLPLPPSTEENRPSAEIIQYDRELLGRTPNIFFRLEW